MRPLTNIYLIGPMGAGKSTIGRQLAKELQLEFHDTDLEVEERSGADISWIFDVEGEEGFRVREKKVIFDLSDKQGVILATGGGAILDPDNRNRLASRGTVVYLTVSVEQQLQRTQKDKRRPLIINSDDLRTDLLAMIEYREPLYREIADITVATDGRTVRGVANTILKELDKSKY